MIHYLPNGVFFRVLNNQLSWDVSVLERVSIIESEVEDAIKTGNEKRMKYLVYVMLKMKDVEGVESLLHTYVSTRLEKKEHEKLHFMFRYIYLRDEKYCDHLLLQHGTTYLDLNEQRIKDYQKRQKIKNRLINDKKKSIERLEA